MRIQSIVFQYAWKIRSEEKSIENPLREAWKRVKLAFRILDDAGSDLAIFAEAYSKAKFCSALRRALKFSASVGMAVQFQYMTKGSKNKPSVLRPAIGTALTSGKYKRTSAKKHKPSANGTYFDIEKNASRSFKIERLDTKFGFIIIPAPVLEAV